MADCMKCANRNNDFCLYGCDNGESFKPITNADRIRAMTDEEIEDWYWWMHKEMMHYTDSYAFVHNWLKQEVSDE